MNLNGKKQSKSKSTKQEIQELKASLKNAEMATRISQMMLKQVIEQFQSMRQDVDNSMGILNDFQYRTQAMLELGNFDVDKLNKIAEGHKLKDYMAASDAEDLAKGYEDDSNGVIGEDSVVIITSSTNGEEDKGIFRSKFQMSECKTETLKESLLGKKVGDKISEDINGDTHEIEILGLRKITAKEAPEEIEADGEENKGN